MTSSYSPRRSVASSRIFAAVLASLSLFFSANLSQAATRIVSNLADSGTGSLRKTIDLAASGDTIEFDPAIFNDPLPRTISLTGGAITIAKNLTIVGPGDDDNIVPMLTLMGSATSRVLVIASPAQVTVTGIGFQGGKATSGGAVFIATGARGTFFACDFRNNSATGSDGGGAIANKGVLVLDQCLVASNTAPVGGGISSYGQLRITRSLITGNTATGFGGGVFSTGADMEIESSTFSGNIGGSGGGVAFVGSGKNKGFASVVAATFTENRSGAQAGGMFVDAGATASIGGSIFAHNFILSGSGSEIPRDLATRKSGKINSADYNIVIKPGESLSPSAPHDQVDVNPLLGPLAFNGGRTKTHAIGPESPAIDRGNPAFLGNLVATDQRALPRASPQPNGRADVGAYEYSGPVLTCPEEFVFECAGSATFGEITANLFLPGGGNATVTWTVNGINTTPSVTNVPAGGVQLTHSGSFHFGSNSASVKVESQGFVLECDTTVEVVDTTAPVITLNPGDSTVDYGGSYADPGAVAYDNCEGTFAATSSGAVDPCTPGNYTITYFATDSSGNLASPVSRTVTVLAPSITVTVPSIVPLITDGSESSTLDLAEIISIEGLPEACGQSPDWLGYVISVLGGGGPIVPDDPGHPSVFTLPVGQYTVSVNVVVLPTGEVLGDASFDVILQLPNVVWPLAIELELDPVDENLNIGLFQQYLAKAGESRWYKFHGAPGGRIEVVLKGLRENFDVVVYKDIQQAYDELIGLVDPTSSTSEQLLALLGAEFAPEAYSPEAYSPEAYSPEAYSPEAYSPEAYSPEAYSPEAYSPEAYSPEAYSPEAYSPEAYSPEAYSPEAYSPEAYSPEAYSPEAYSSAQGRSLLAFSASPGTTSEIVTVNTYNSTGVFYVRVRGQNGAFSTETPYDLAVAVEQALCAGVEDPDPNWTPTIDFDAPTTNPPTSLFVWDSARMVYSAGTDAGDLASALNAFAVESDGVVVDVSEFPHIAALQTLADDNTTCPYAKNLVAEAIRLVIAAYRTEAPSIKYITLIGPDTAIPFFRENDEALLASEGNYFPPVLDPTHSQSALRYAQVLTQWRYGSDCSVSLSTGSYSLPKAAVGRLVESAAEVITYLEAYQPLFEDSDGVLPLSPTPSVLSVGYDFLADVAEAISDELREGLGAGATVDELISPYNLPPAFGWTANDLRTALLTNRHDIAYLAGHFSQSGALAADYTTRFTAAELAASTVDLAYALFVIPGCHGGYNTVDNDAVPLVTETPDWSQAFSRKLATMISGTGYQYGDTDFIEYTERLHLEIVRELRRGTEPVAIGDAMVTAMNNYLSQTPLMRGIHEKTLLQATLFGLPMVKMDLPGLRLPWNPPVSDVTSTTPVTAGPGADHGLTVGQLTVAPVTPFLKRVEEVLDVVGTEDTITTTYFEGSGGISTVVGEPVRAVEPRNVSRSDIGLVRGVGFRGGNYVDEFNIIPFTGAPATEVRGVHAKFETDVFYPARPWNLNQIGELCGTGGVSVLNAFPTQFLSDGLESVTGTLRRFENMDFSVFYCPEVSEAALAIPPAINYVASEVDGTNVLFSIEVAAPAGVGVQEVWITHTDTGTPGSGSWESLTLTPDDPSGIGTWTGTLPLGGSNPAAIRFMVQAVNDIGAVSLNTNFGRYFKIGDTTLDGVGVAGAPTSLAFVDIDPSSGVYRDAVEVTAQLTTAGDPSGKRITFRMGPVARSAFTNSSGIATAELLLNMRPEVYDLEAVFAGDVVDEGSSANETFVVSKRPTALVFESGGILSGASSIVVTLASNNGIPLKERTVLFVLTSGSTSIAIAEITDGAGQARVTRPVPTGANYVVTAYFGQSVTLPTGALVALDDPLYGPSTATTTVTLSKLLEFSGEQAWVNYSDQSAPGATSGNRGHSSTEIAGDFTANDPNFGPASVMATAKSKNVDARIRAVLSDQTIAEGTIRLRVQGSGGIHWHGGATISGTSVDLNVDWNGSGGTGKYHVWIDTPNGSGPLYNDVPVILSFELIVGVGSNEKPAGGVSVIGGPDKPWTSENANSRTRIP